RLELVDGAVRATHPELGALYLESEDCGEWWFTENDTNAPKLFGVPSEAGRVYKDAFHEALVGGRWEALAPPPPGTKAGPAGGGGGRGRGGAQAALARAGERRVRPCQRDLRRARRRSRSLPRRAAARRERPGAAPRAAPGARRPALEPPVLRLRRAAVAARR